MEAAKAANAANAANSTNNQPSSKALKNKKKKLKRKQNKTAKLLAAAAEKEAEKAAQSPTPTTTTEKPKAKAKSKRRPKRKCTPEWTEDEETSEEDSSSEEGREDSSDPQDDSVEDEEEDEDELEDECFEPGGSFNDHKQFEFVKDYILSPKTVEGTTYQRERHIFAFGNGDEQMTRGIENFVTQLANNFGGQGCGQSNHQQTSSYITERRNKKRKELAQSIFDQNPFTGASVGGNAPPNSTSGLFGSFRIPD